MNNKKNGTVRRIRRRRTLKMNAGNIRRVVWKGHLHFTIPFKGEETYKLPFSVISNVAHGRPIVSSTDWGTTNLKMTVRKPRESNLRRVINLGEYDYTDGCRIFLRFEHCTNLLTLKRALKTPTAIGVIKTSTDNENAQMIFVWYSQGENRFTAFIPNDPIMFQRELGITDNLNDRLYLRAPDEPRQEGIVQIDLVEENEAMNVELIPNNEMAHENEVPPRNGERLQVIGQPIEQLNPALRPPIIQINPHLPNLFEEQQQDNAQPHVAGVELALPVANIPAAVDRLPEWLILPFRSRRQLPLLVGQQQPVIAQPPENFQQPPAHQMVIQVALNANERNNVQQAARVARPIPSPQIRLVPPGLPRPAALPPPLERRQEALPWPAPRNQQRAAVAGLQIIPGNAIRAVRNRLEVGYPIPGIRENAAQHRAAVDNLVNPFHDAVDALAGLGRRVQVNNNEVRQFIPRENEQLRANNQRQPLPGIRVLNFNNFEHEFCVMDLMESVEL